MSMFFISYVSLDSSACWPPVCNEYETDEVQSVLSARVLDARKENARAYSARGKNFTSLTENRNENYGVGGKTRQRKTKNRKERRESQNGNSARASVKGSLECDSLQNVEISATILAETSLVIDHQENVGKKREKRKMEMRKNKQQGHI